MGAHQCRHEGAQLVGAGKAAPVQVATCWGNRRVDPRKPGAKRQAGDSSMGAKPRPVWRYARPPGFNGPRQSVDVVLIDCNSKQAKHKLGRVVLRPKHRTGPRGTPPKDGGRWSLTRSEGAKAKAARRGAAPTQPAQVMEHHRSAPPESADRKAPLCGRAAGLTFR